jgi:signal transduction histidine kinase
MPDERAGRERRPEELDALREAARRAASESGVIFDLIPEAVRICDVDGRFVRVNPLAARLASGVESVHELWARSRPRDERGTPVPVEESPSLRALRGEETIARMLQVTHGDAELVIEVSATPLRDPRGAIVGAVSATRDVTERERFSRGLERLVEERTRQITMLQERHAREQRLAAVGQLAAGVMHDVNNLLNPIMAAAYLLQRHAGDPDLVRRHAARIAQAADTGAALTERLARFIRQQPLHESLEDTVDLKEVCEEAVSLGEPVRGSDDAALVVECTGEPGVLVRGVAAELRAAVLNLIRNAADATPSTGVVRLAVRAEGDDAIVEVRDTGTGMAPETMERAFEPFFTTKGPRGTGLGLAEVYGVVRRHRGRTEIDSAPGQGTTIRLVLPRAPRPA